jgi:hypothetical protein
MKRLLLTILLCACVTPAVADPQFTVITQTIAVDRGADQTWRKIGEYCSIRLWTAQSCVYLSGSGDVGSIRNVNDHFIELLVARTSRSYTYYQPGSSNMYHGTLAVEPDGTERSRIVYTMVYDVSALITPQAIATDRDKRINGFLVPSLQRLKALAEGQ